MSIRSTPIVGSQAEGLGSTFSVKSLSLYALGKHASPVVVLDNFRVMGHPFGPHPHAGMSAVTYVLEDSSASLRSRDSLGNDIIMGAGGIVWTQAGSGILHDELPAEPGRELHGLQVFINLSSKSKMVAPRVLKLASHQMQEWHGGGDRVRVVVGSFEGVSSPLVPAEPFDWLDISLRREISFELPSGRNALIYGLSGCVSVRTDDGAQSLESEQAMAVHGDGGRVTFQASSPAHFLVLSGLEIREPVVTGSGFIMNDRSQLETAAARYRAGQMGHLAPLSGSSR